MSKLTKVRLDKFVDGTDSEVLFHFCAFSDHALDNDFEENEELEDLLEDVGLILEKNSQIQTLLSQIPEEHEKKPDFFWKISEIILNYLKTKGDIKDVAPKFFFMSTLPTYKTRHFQAKHILNFFETFPHISEVWNRVDNKKYRVSGNLPHVSEVWNRVDNKKYIVSENLPQNKLEESITKMDVEEQQNVTSEDFQNFMGKVKLILEKEREFNENFRKILNQKEESLKKCETFTEEQMARKKSSVPNISFDELKTRRIPK
jgi:hypothetical protein